MMPYALATVGTVRKSIADRAGEMIAYERLPGLRRGRARPPRGPGHVLGDRIFGDFVAQLRERA